MDSARAAISADATGEPYAIAEDLFCPECAYNLRGVTGERCPECGYALASVRSRSSGIPWTYRDKIGWFRAYWRTVWLVIFRQRRFCEEISRPVSFVDSQQFRWATVILAYAPLLFSTAAAYSAQYSIPVGRRPPAAAPIDELLAAVWPIIVLHACFLLALAAITGVPSYFFHPRGLPVLQQNRALALSYYAAAPLALAVPVWLAGVLAGALLTRANLSVWLAALLVLIPMFLWWRNLRSLARRAMPDHRRRRVFMSVLLPILWLTLAGLTLAGVPLLIIYPALIIASLS